MATFGTGMWLGVEMIHRLSHFGDLERLALSQSTASTVFDEARGDAAREALLKNMEVLDRLGPAALSPTELTVDRLVTLIRLWKVESAAGRIQQAADYRMKAQQVCEDAKWRDCSDQAMSRLVDRP